MAKRKYYARAIEWGFVYETVVETASARKVGDMYYYGADVKVYSDKNYTRCISAAKYNPETDKYYSVTF